MSSLPPPSRYFSEQMQHMLKSINIILTYFIYCCKGKSRQKVKTLFDDFVFFIIFNSILFYSIFLILSLLQKNTELLLLSSLLHFLCCGKHFRKTDVFLSCNAGQIFMFKFSAFHSIAGGYFAADRTVSRLNNLNTPV